MGTPEGIFALAGTLAVAGLGIAIVGASASPVVALLAASAVLLLTGLVLQVTGSLRPLPPQAVQSSSREEARETRHRLGLLLRRRRGWLALALVVLLSLLAVGGGSLLPSFASASRDREFTIEATRFAYSPGVIRVNKGDHVTIRLRAEDVMHGLYIDGYDLEVQADPDREGVLEFEADRVGKFKFRCSATCGPLHPFMLGELVVETNGPFYGAAGLALMVTAGSVAYFWWQRRENDGAGG